MARRPIRGHVQQSCNRCNTTARDVAALLLQRELYSASPLRALSSPSHAFSPFLHTGLQCDTVAPASDTARGTPRALQKCTNPKEDPPTKKHHLAPGGTDTCRAL